LQNQDRQAGPAQPLIDVGPEDLAREDFGYRLAQLSQGFENRFGRALTITGTDTPEHVRLHGRGMAADIRTHGLGPEHLDWLRQQTQQLGLTGRDYSWLTGPVTTSTGVRLTGPHFHVHYGGGGDYRVVPSVNQTEHERPGVQRLAHVGTEAPASAEDWLQTNKPDRSDEAGGTNQERGSVETWLQDQSAPQESMLVFGDALGRPFNEGEVTIHAGPTKTAKSLEEQVADAQKSGQRIATGISAPDLLARLQAGTLSPQQLYLELQNRVAKNPPSHGGFGMNDAQIELWKQDHQRHHPVEFINLLTGAPRTPEEVALNFARQGGAYVPTWDPKQYQAMRDYARRGPGADVPLKEFDPQPESFDLRALEAIGSLDPLALLTEQQFKSMARTLGLDPDRAWAGWQAQRRQTQNLAGGYAQGALGTLGDAATGLSIPLRDIGLTGVAGEAAGAGDWLSNATAGAQDQDSVAAHLGSSLGSASDYLLASAAGGQPLSAVLGGLSGAGSTYKEAKAMGADETTAQLVALAGGGIGAAQGLIGPAKILTNAIDQQLTGPLLQAAVREFLHQATLAGSAQAAHNILAKLSYDPQRGIFQDVPSAAGYGGTVGSLLGGLGAVGGEVSGQRSAVSDQGAARGFGQADNQSGTGAAPEPLPLGSLPTLDSYTTGREWPTAPLVAPQSPPSESRPSYEEVVAKRLNPPSRNEGLFELIRRYSRPKSLLEKIRDISISGPALSRQRYGQVKPEAGLG